MQEKEMLIKTADTLVEDTYQGELAKAIDDAYTDMMGENDIRERFYALDKYRVKQGLFATTSGDAKGLFMIPTAVGQKNPAKVLCSPFIREDHEAKPPGAEWQHVSVSFHNRTPKWEEMCLIKEMFWGDDDTVVQFHPKKSEYVNLAVNCLHLRSLNDGTEFPTPPKICV